jgi:hypothetical protein
MSAAAFYNPYNQNSINTNFTGGASAPSGSTQNTTPPTQQETIQSFASMLGRPVKASALPTNLATGEAISPGSRIDRSYGYGSGMTMQEFLKKKGQALGLNDSLMNMDLLSVLGR